MVAIFPSGIYAHDVGPPMSAPPAGGPPVEAPEADATTRAVGPMWQGAQPQTETESDSEDDAPIDLPEITFRLSGFISATAFAQDQSFGFGNGQRTVWAANQQTGVDQWFMGGDVRNTRLRLSTETDPGDGGWAARGVLEMDFFGSFNGGGAFNDEQPQPRMRLAYVELEKGGTLVRVGQSFTPLFGLVPVSVTHIAFPLGLGSAGMLGWRYPGLLVRQRLSEEDSDLQVAVTGGAFRGSWEEGEFHDPSDILEHMSAGEAGLPQFEVRLDLARQGTIPWNLHIVGHWDRKDLSGTGQEYAVDNDLTGTAITMGGRVDVGPWTAMGGGYVGRAIGQQFGALTQFGDIRSRGGWFQIGYEIAPKLSAWLFRGVGDPNDDDVRATSNYRTLNNNAALSAIYDLGPYKAGVEWMCSRTRWIEGINNFERTAHQFSFSLLYGF
jgi:hypothetical protein